MTKEFLINEDSPTQENALARLFEELHAYLEKHQSKSWKWRKEPEVQQYAPRGIWKAYARIEIMNDR